MCLLSVELKNAVPVSIVGTPEVFVKVIVPSLVVYIFFPCLKIRYCTIPFAEASGSTTETSLLLLSVKTLVEAT